MIRSAGLTLGGILLLGGASAVHADDLSASGAPPAIEVAPAMYGVFSRVPENWSDLPVQFNLSERAGYNSNILNTPLTKSGGVTGVRQPGRQSGVDLELQRLNEGLLGRSAILRRRLDRDVPVFF